MDVLALLFEETFHVASLALFVLANHVVYAPFLLILFLFHLLKMLLHLSFLELCAGVPRLLRV